MLATKPVYAQMCIRPLSSTSHLHSHCELVECMQVQCQLLYGHMDEQLLMLELYIILCYSLAKWTSSCNVCRTASCLKHWQAYAMTLSLYLVETAGMTARCLCTTYKKTLYSSSLMIRKISPPPACLAQKTCAPTPPPTPGCSLQIEVSYCNIAETLALSCLTTNVSSEEHPWHNQCTCRLHCNMS